MAPPKKHDYSSDLQDQMLDLFKDMAWKDVSDELGLTCSKQVFFDHIRAAEIRRDAEFYAVNRNGSEPAGRVFAEFNHRPEDRKPGSELPPAKAVGFEGYNANYMGCATCGYRTWQSPDAPSMCPRCQYPMQIIG